VRVERTSVLQTKTNPLESTVHSAQNLNFRAYLAQDLAQPGEETKKEPTARKFFPAAPATDLRMPFEPTTMKKFIAAVLIAFFTLTLIAGTANVGKYVPASSAENIGYRLGALTGLILDITFLFYGVRWYIKLSGHTYKVARQTWAAILFWYSMLALVMGIGFLMEKEIIGGGIYLVVWGIIGFSCWKWRQRLRQKEVQLKAETAVSI
jgi:hypothetical protein